MKRKTHADEKKTCPSCLTLNSQFAVFCGSCGSPIGAVATIDPMQRIRADAFLLSKAIEGRPRLSVLLVIGIPMPFLVIVATIMAVKTLLYERGWANWIYFWMMVGLSTLAFLILYRVTKNYFTGRKK